MTSIKSQKKVKKFIGKRHFDLSGWQGRLGRVLETECTGHDMINDSLLNKGTAFTMSERDRFGLRGLLPPRSFSSNKEAMETQSLRVKRHLDSLGSDLDKHLALANLQDRNEQLYYKVLTDNIKELAPIVYTPTVGTACTRFGEKYTRPRGMYFSYYDRGNMDAMVYNWDQDDVQVIVITDGSRILGLGDLGSNGMGIPIGKLSLYVACAGIHPSRVLPIMFDIGTNNQELLDDPLYMGVRRNRPTSDEFDKLLEELIRALQHRWPWALIQFEDFSSNNALRVLEEYKKKVMCFNDDIQGTGSVALAGILASLKSIGQVSPEALCNQKVFIVGAGSAGCGIGDAIRFGMQTRGLDSEEAHQRFFMFDDKGLLGAGYKAVDELQSEFIREDLPNGQSILDAIKEYEPTILIGVTGCPGLFTEDIIKAMCEHTERPLIFPLSNPTSRAECTIEEVCRISDGKAIFASGSPFQNVEHNGKTFYANQMNNMYAFPGLGLGAIACLPRVITDDILQTVSQCLADCVDETRLSQGQIFPDIGDIHLVSRKIAWAVTQKARKDGLARKQNLPQTQKQFAQYIFQKVWAPEYATYVKKANDKVNIHESPLDLSEFCGSSGGKSSLNEPW